MPILSLLFACFAAAATLETRAPAVVAALGSPEQPLRVAVVGAGPAGFFAADALLKQKGAAVQVDMFEALPTPYGLVRSGLAPDHQALKGASKVYDRIADNPAFRYFGNVAVGRDIDDADLAKMFDQVVYAVGAPQPKTLGVKGEELAGVHPANEFIGLYNSHPDHVGRRFDLSGESAVVIGAGNSAVDVVRLLAQDPAKLAGTDISAPALEALRGSGVKNVYLLARRGPGQAAFSAAELKALSELQSADVVVRPQDIEAARAGADALAAPAKKTFDLLAERAAAGEGARERKVRLLFFSAPAELEGRDGKIEGVRVERTRLVEDGKGGLRAQGTGEFETIPAQLVFHAIGWKGRAMPGLPFDARAGRIPSADGRVAGMPGRYVAGWARNGGAGLLGDQMRDAAATVKSMIADLPSVTPAAERRRGAVDALLESRGVRAVSFADWKALDALEVAAGQAAGKVRAKFATVAEMLAALRAKADN